MNDLTTQYCGCPRSGDLWHCNSRDDTGYPRRCDPVTGKGCALLATFNATGRDVWDGTAQRAIEQTPCPCAGVPSAKILSE